MELKDLKPGMQIEAIGVLRKTPKCGVILRIELNNKSGVSNEPKPIIIGLTRGDKGYTEWWTSLDYLDITWRLTGKNDETKKAKPTRTKKSTSTKNTAKTKKAR